MKGFEKPSGHGMKFTLFIKKSIISLLTSAGETVRKAVKPVQFAMT